MVSSAYEAQATLFSTPMSMLGLPMSYIRLVKPLFHLFKTSAPQLTTQRSVNGYPAPLSTAWCRAEEHRGTMREMRSEGLSFIQIILHLFQPHQAERERNITSLPAT